MKIGTSEIELNSLEYALLLGCLGSVDLINQAKQFNVNFEQTEEEEDDNPIPQSKESEDKCDTLIDFLNQVVDLEKNNPDIIRHLQDKIRLHMDLSSNTFLSK